MYGDKEVDESYWVLVTKDVIPNSRSLNFGAQEKLLPEQYTHPKLIEIAVCNFMYNVKENEKLYEMTGEEEEGVKISTGKETSSEVVE